MARSTPTHTIDVTVSGTSDEEPLPIVKHDRLAELPSDAIGARWGRSFHSLSFMKMDLSRAEELVGVPLEVLAAAITLIEGQSYVELRAKGISCVSKDNATVSAVQLHRFGHERYSRYTGVLPGKLEFMMGRSQVRAALGTPQQSGEASAVPILGVKPPWDAFVIGRLRVHIEYTDTCDSIGMVTLTKHIK